MQLWTQIAHGTLFLTIASGLHLALIILSLPWLTRIAEGMKDKVHAKRAGVLISLSFALIVLGHTIQVWVWAGAFVWFEAIDSIDTAVYFALTSYTTLGFGDIILDENTRIFGAFSAVCGLLTFGVSTAFLVGMIERVLPRPIR